MQTFLWNKSNPRPSRGKVYLTEYGTCDRNVHYRRYIAQFPLETMFEYNNKLLDLEPKVTEEDVMSMTEQQKTDMLLKLLAKN